MWLWDEFTAAGTTSSLVPASCLWLQVNLAVWWVHGSAANSTNVIKASFILYDVCCDKKQQLLNKCNNDRAQRNSAAEDFML